MILVALIAAFSFGAMVTVAFAVSYHTTCVGHGFVEGSSQTDGSFFSRVETGCGSTYRRCEIYTDHIYRGAQITGDTGTTCNAWSRDFGTLTECASTARTYNAGVYSEHSHTAPNWCL